MTAPALPAGVPLASNVRSGAEALDQLGSVLTALGACGYVALLHDATPKHRAGKDLLSEVRARLRAFAVHDIAVPAPAPGHDVVLDEATLAMAVDAVAQLALPPRGGTPAPVVALVCVGSGTITDLGKVVAATVDIPLVAVQTAASVNGYSDPLSVIVKSGAKRTIASQYPDALVIDDAVLAAAPRRLTAAGVGDAVAVWCAPADWGLACAMGMDEGFDAEVFSGVAQHVAALAQAEPFSAPGMAHVREALTLGGLWLGAVGSTAPLSGCEHLISHLLDMRALALGIDHDLHGAQVGAASVAICRLWHIAHDELDLPAVLAEADLAAPRDLTARVQAAFAPLDPSGALVAECLAAVRKKWERWQAGASQRAQLSRDAWARCLAPLHALVAPPEQVCELLRRWEAPAALGELSPAVDAGAARWALSALPLMRDRFTLPDLLLAAGLWDDAFIARLVGPAEFQAR